MVMIPQDNNYLYMVMELCRGGELLDVITCVIQYLRLGTRP